MDNEERKDFEDLFASNGWKRLIEQAELEIEGIKDALVGPIPYEQVQFFRGQIAQLQTFVHMEGILASAIEGNEDADL